MTAHVAHNTGNNEWYTPADIIERARRVFGGRIDLDPASNPAAQEIVKAGKFYTAEQNGLAFPWEGTVWLNPPYSAALIKCFAEKLAFEWEAGRVTEAIVLTNNATETAWFQMIARISSAVCFPRGRVKFWAPGKPLATPLQGQAITYIGWYPDLFGVEFEEIGTVFGRDVVTVELIKKYTEAVRRAKERMNAPCNLR